MKKIIAISIIIIIASIGQANAGWDNWTINGVPMSKFKNASLSDVVKLSAGIGASIVTHWVGHVAYLELSGTDWHQDGLQEMIDQDFNNHQSTMFGISGLGSQLLVGSIIKYSGISDSMFATGYQFGSFIEVTTYPAIWGFGGDDDIIEGDLDFNGSKIAWAAMSAWSVINMK